MTTAHLSVGIDTSQAYASLKALRAEMQNQPHNLLLSVDATKLKTDIDRELGKAFGGKDRKLLWAVATFRAEINGAIDPIFNDATRRLRFDQVGLTAQVHAAVAAGLGGGVVRVNGVVGAGAPVAAAAAVASVPGIQNTIRETLLPAVDRMVLAAESLAAVARRTSVGGTVGSAKAARSISAKDENGYTTRFSQTLDNPDLVHSELKNSNQEKAAKQAIQEIAREEQRSSDLTFRARRSFRRAEETEAKAAAREAQRSAQETAREEQRSSTLTYAARRSFRRAEETEAKAAARAQQKGLDAGMAFGPDRSTFDASRAAARAAGSKEEIESNRKSLKALTGTMNEAHSAARGLASGFGAMWLTWGQIGPLMAGAAISHSFVQSLKDGMAVSQELATIKYMGGESAASVSALNAALLNTAANGPFGPRETSMALKTLSLAGLNATQQLQALQSVMNFSIAGQVSLEKSAEVLVAVSTAYGYTAKDFNVVGDIVTKAAASSMASVDSMSESFKSASVVAQQYKVSLEDTAITIALLSQVGIKGSAAGTAMRQMYSELSGASSKAREIITNTLKVDVLDNFTGGMRPLVSIITDLSIALDKFGPKAQQRILQEMGNERGTKALAANLSALRTEYTRTGQVASNELLRMQQLMQSAPGFMAEAAVGMSLTSQNQMKAVASALEGSLVKAFQKIEPSVLQVSMKMREMFLSSEFQAGVTNSVTLVANFTSTLINHAGIITDVVKAYILWKAVTISASALTALGAGVTLLTAGYSALGVRATVAAIATTGVNAALVQSGAATTVASAGFLRLQASMGWIGVLGVAVAALAAAWMLYKDKSIDSATTAGEAARTAAEATSKSMLAEIATLEKTMALRKQGVKEELLAQEASANIALENIHAMNVEERAILKVVHAQNLLNQSKMYAAVGDTPNVENAIQLQRVDANVEESRTNLANSYFKESEQDTEFETLRRRLRNLAKQNASEATAEAAGRQRQTSGTQDFEGIDSKKDRSAHNAVMSELADKKSAYELDVKNIEAKYKTEDVLLKARHSAGLISAEAYETRLETIAERHSKERVAIAEKERIAIQAVVDKATAADLGKPKNKQSLTDEDRAKINRDLTEATAKAQAANADELNRAAVAALKMEGALRSAKDVVRDIRMSHAVEDMKAVRDLSLRDFDNNSNRGLGAGVNQSLYGPSFTPADTSPEMKEEIKRSNYERSLSGKLNKDTTLQGQGAKDVTMKAALAAYDSYSNNLLKLAIAMETAQEQLDEVNSRRAGLVAKLESDLTSNVEANRTELANLSNDAIKLSANVKGAGDAIAAVEAMRDNSIQVRAKAAQDTYEYERSDQAGMLSFWRQYRAEATDTASLVNNVMSQAFSSMQQGLLQFVTTGKLNFKDFARSIAADAARMMANAAIKQLLSLAVNYALSSGGTTGASQTSGNASIGGGSEGGYVMPTASPNAHGGVMTSRGVRPLTSFAKGGIAHGPVYSEHGEGSLPEANVPLQDGRTIPVTISGGTGGGNTTVNINVRVDSNGKSNVESDTSGKKAEQLGKMLDGAVTQIIQREKRPGGLLYA